MGKAKLDTQYLWRKKNLMKYEFTLNKATNKVAYEHFSKQPNRRLYLIKLIEEDAKRGKK